MTQAFDSPVPSFRGRLWFCSNFYPTEVEYEGVSYPTAEHAYQAAKAVTPGDRMAILCCRTPGDAKRLGKRLEPLYWSRIKLNVMWTVLEAKFAGNVDIRLALAMDTPKEIIEYNLWHDTFWGKCCCPRHSRQGENWLGRLLMEIRDRPVSAEHNNHRLLEGSPEPHGLSRATAGVLKAGLK